MQNTKMCELIVNMQKKKKVCKFFIVTQSIFSNIYFIKIAKWSRWQIINTLSIMVKKAFENLLLLGIFI